MGLLEAEGIDFQSHAGSIEACCSGWLDVWGVKSFNPTLVRLRPCGVVTIQAQCLSFQSHAGSIEALPVAGAQPGEELLSIPRWFD